MSLTALALWACGGDDERLGLQCRHHRRLYRYSREWRPCYWRRRVIQKVNKYIKIWIKQLEESFVDFH